MWKINTLVLLISFLLSCKQTAKDPNCSDFKFGTFHYTAGKTGNKYLITRTADSIQTERNITSGDITRAHIKWIDDCEYQLTYIDEVVSNKDTIVGYLKTHTLNTRILKTKSGKENGNWYSYSVFESSMIGTNLKLVDTLWKKD